MNSHSTLNRSAAKTYVDYVSGPVKIKDGLYMGDESAAKVFSLPVRTLTSL